MVLLSCGHRHIKAQPHRERFNFGISETLIIIWSLYYYHSDHFEFDRQKGCQIDGVQTLLESNFGLRPRRQ